jgi:PEGA domain
MKRFWTAPAMFIVILGCSDVVQAGSRILTITSEPSGARVELDGTYMGSTPLTLDPHCGNSCFTGNAPQWALSNHLTHAATMTVSRAGCETKSVAMTEGPFNLFNGFGQLLFEYYLYSSDRFHVVLACNDSSSKNTGRSTITFLNQSGTDVLIRISGPSNPRTKIKDKSVAKLKVQPGAYTVLARFGGNPGEYVYSKGEPMTITETQTEHSAATIVLRRPLKDDPDAHGEFDAAAFPIVWDASEDGNVRVAGVRFFEGPPDTILPPDKRNYQDGFRKSSIRGAIYVEVHLQVTEIDHPNDAILDSVWYRQNGSIHFQSNGQFTLRGVSGDVLLVSNGCRCTKSNRCWEVGSYTVKTLIHGLDQPVVARFSVY